MKKWFVILICALPFYCLSQENRKLFFLNLARLEFDVAKQNATIEADSNMRFEMLQLADILFYEGQKERTYFKLSETTADSKDLLFMRLINDGYIHLFYDRVKGNAYKSFYGAYQLALESEDSSFIKASLLAFFRYYDFEKVQVSDSYQIHLDHFESLKEDFIDEVWLTIYKLIFYSKPLKSVGTDSRYFELVKSMDGFEKRIDISSPVLTFVYFEQAIKYEVAGDLANEKSVEYYKKAINQAKDFPFLKDEKFHSLIKLLNIETTRKRLLLANEYFEEAKKQVIPDTLRYNFYLNYYSSLLLHALGRNDSAFILMEKAYYQDLDISHMKNNLQMNRLNAELRTQEKENANLRLRENRTWLISALVGVGFLFLASYFAYANQLSKNRMQEKEKEVQAMKLEKVLKDQEIFGIDAMIEGQEKERQRIAADLHDNLGSALATVKLHFQHIKARKDLNGSEQELLLQKTDDLLEEAYQKVRGIAHAGNAGVNAQEGLLPSIKNFASKVSIINRLEIDVEEHGMNKRMENSLEITVFRIIQELITNIIKHANATAAVIHLTHHEDAINLMVEDNGNGFDISTIKPSGGMGLHSIQKKIENLGGRVTIDSIVQKGTTVIIDIPLT